MNRGGEVELVISKYCDTTSTGVYKYSKIFRKSNMKDKDKNTKIRNIKREDSKKKIKEMRKE